MQKECMLTTIDNPFNPFEDFISWFLFDVEKGYNTCSKLARFANFSPDLSESERQIENEKAVDRLLELDFMNIYKKIYKNN